MQRGLSNCLTLVVVISALSACTETRVMTLPAAPADLFDPGKPVRVTGSSVVADRHGDVVAGAGEGAGKGMLQGAGGSIMGGLSSGHPAGLALGIFLSPLFAIGGGIYGAAAAHPAEETEAAITAIERVYNDQAFLGSLADTLQDQVAALGFGDAQPCPPSQSAVRATLVSREDCFTGPVNRLRMTVTYAFATTGSYSPDLQFAIDVEAVAANANRTREAEGFRWIYVSPELDFFAATANDAAQLRSNVADAHRRLSQKIMDDLLIARREETVLGYYMPTGGAVQFQPGAMPRGVATRLPTRSDTIAPELPAAPAQKAPTPAPTSSAREKAAGSAPPKQEGRRAPQKRVEAPFYCSVMPLPNSNDECRAAIEAE